MSEALQDEPLVTIAEFDAFLDRQTNERLWDLVAGQIVAMTNPTGVHEQIVANVGQRLKVAADARGCQAFFGGMRVQRSGQSKGVDKPRPDLLVRCGAMFDGNFVTDPLIVVEVLSPSTMDVDRGHKLHFYKRLPTMTDILFVYQNQVRVEHYRRTHSGWEMQEFTERGDLLDLDSIGCRLFLQDAYFGTSIG